MRNKFLAVAMAAVGLAVSGVSMAATNGTVGATSTGTVVINATIPKLIRITGLADITMVLPAPVDDDLGYTAAATGSSPACVRQNGGTATYGIVATSANTAFELTNGTLAPVPYSLTWGGTALAYNAALTAQAPDSTTLGSCADVAGKLEVSIAAADLNDAEGSAVDYTDTVTLVVTPE